MWFFCLGAKGERGLRRRRWVLLLTEGKGREKNGKVVGSSRGVVGLLGVVFHQQCYFQVLFDVRPGYVFYRKLRGISSRVNNPPPPSNRLLSPNPLSRPSRDAP
jgi:hypothetical protein